MLQILVKNAIIYIKSSSIHQNERSIIKHIPDFHHATLQYLDQNKGGKRNKKTSIFHASKTPKSIIENEKKMKIQKNENNQTLQGTQTNEIKIFYKYGKKLDISKDRTKCISKNMTKTNDRNLINTIRGQPDEEGRQKGE